MEFNHLCARLFRSSDLCLSRGDKETDLDPAVADLPHSFNHSALKTDYVKATLGRQFLPFLRNQCGHLRVYLTRDRHHLISSCHLQVQFRSDYFTQEPHIPVLYVTPVFPKMNNDPGGSCHLRNASG